MAIDKERENHVYIAKLAEQAERYDGLSFSLSQTFFFFFFFFFFFSSVWFPRKSMD